MPHKCSVYNCRSNYRENKGNCCTVYRLPAALEERKKWINALPYFNLSNCELSNFRVCLKHWETNCPIEMKFAVKNNSYSV